MLTLKELSAKVVSLLARVDEGMKAEVTALKTAVDETMAQLSADLATAKASISDLTSQLTAKAGEIATLTAAASTITTSLDAACSALKLELKADASAADKITALQTAVSTNLAKLGVDAKAIPAAKATSGNLAADNKTLTMDQFRAASPGDKMTFLKAGGKIVE